MDDQQIVDAITAGDEAGLQELMRRYGPLLRYVVAPILPDLREQEECLSDIYVKLWERAGTFDITRGSLSAWLTVIARNTALNRARQAREPLHPLEDAAQVPTPEGSAEDILLAQERRAALMQAIRTLNEREQELFYRKYYYCQSTAQIGAEMHLSVRAVEGRLHRLRKALRKKLGGEWDG